MVQLTWQGSPEVVRNYKKALETLNMLILPHLLKKKKKDWANFDFNKHQSPHMSACRIFSSCLFAGEYGRKIKL